VRTNRLKRFIAVMLTLIACVSTITLGQHAPSGTDATPEAPIFGRIEVKYERLSFYPNAIRIPGTAVPLQVALPEIE
jgi:hypothetical protein